MGIDTNRVEWYRRYFSTNYGISEQPTVHEACRAYSEIFRDWLPEDRAAPILDVGAGVGFAVRWLKTVGYTNVSGIDVSHEQCLAAERICGVRVEEIKDTLAYLAAGRAKYGLILMTDVIEHLPKMQVVPHLHAIYGALKPGGRLIVKTENMASPVGRYQYYMDFTHEYCFTEKSLRQVLAMAGFEDIEIRGQPYRVGRRPRALKRAMVRVVWWWLLRQLYEAERPVGNNPTIFSMSLIACGRRPSS